MSNQLESIEDDIIRSWHERAHAYNKLIDRWPVFTQMVNRLLACMPEEFNGHALDIAGGSGLLSQHLLKKFPNARVTLVEPAENMRALALRRLGDQIEIQNVTCDKLDTLNIIADAALCSAAFHLMDEQSTLPSVATALKPGAMFAVNLWGHSFDETATLDRKMNWTQFVDEALIESNLPPMKHSKKPMQKVKCEVELNKIGAQCGLHLVGKTIVTDEIATSFNIEFAALNSSFPHPMSVETRAQVINRAIELCHGVDTITSVDLKFEKA